MCLSGVSMQVRATSLESAHSLHHRTFYQLGKEPSKNCGDPVESQVLT